MFLNQKKLRLLSIFCALTFMQSYSLLSSNDSVAFANFACQLECSASFAQRQRICAVIELTCETGSKFVTLHCCCKGSSWNSNCAVPRQRPWL